MLNLKSIKIENIQLENIQLDRWYFYDDMFIKFLDKVN